MIANFALFDALILLSLISAEFVQREWMLAFKLFLNAFKRLKTAMGDITDLSPVISILKYFYAKIGRMEHFSE